MTKINARLQIVLLTLNQGLVKWMKITKLRVGRTGTPKAMDKIVGTFSNISIRNVCLKI